MPSIRIDVDRQYGVPLRDGYDYITDPERWPGYWPNLVRVAPGARWSAPGDVARLTMKLLGRATELEMTLVRIEPYRLVEYTSRQRGLPEARHERHFAESGAGLHYRIVIELEPRGGPRGLLDRLVVARAVERTATQTLDNLERQFSAR